MVFHGSGSGKKVGSDRAGGEATQVGRRPADDNGKKAGSGDGRDGTRLVTTMVTV